MVELHIARALLWFCAPVEHVDAILGDLIEEYRGAHLAHGWLLSQSLRSAAPLLLTRWRRGDLAGLIAAAMVTILAPLRLADLLWAFVHSQIPLKADLQWPTWIWIANLVIAMSGAVVLGYGARTSRSVVTRALLALACAGISMALSTGHAPVWYITTLSLMLSGVIPTVHILRTRMIPS
jgi:hypothetical protein